MKSPKIENELCPTHPPGEAVQEKPIELVEDNHGLPLDMVRQTLQGRQERLSGQSSEYKLGRI